MHDQEAILAETEERLHYFLEVTDYEIASNHYYKRISPMLDLIEDSEVRSDMRFDFMEHLHDLSLPHATGVAY